VTIMPTLFWLALLLGYLAGVAAAVVLLPARLVEPLAGPLTLTTVIAVAAFGVLLRLRQARRRDPYAEAAPSEAPAAGPAAPRRPRLPEAEAAAPDRAPDHRWPLRVGLEPPGTIGPRELQRLLADGRVDVGLRPIASLAQPDAAVYHVLPRLHAADDSPIAPARYRASAARCGLLGLIDQRLVRRSAELLRKARAEGREVVMVCSIAADSLSNPAFGAELGQQLSDDPELAAELVLALDQAVRDQPGAAALARLRLGGIRFCLRRVGPPPLDPAELGASGFSFVLLEAARTAGRPSSRARWRTRRTSGSPSG
jgi:cyclic-di-GMP phosphodiesterase TipF (flagellum assembly factor)